MCAEAPLSAVVSRAQKAADVSSGPDSGDTEGSSVEPLEPRIAMTPEALALGMSYSRAGYAKL